MAENLEPVWDLHNLRVPVRYSQKLDLFIQGDYKNRAGKVVFVTVHDVGYNHRSFVPFVQYEAMQELKQKSIWIHVCLPGQDEDAETLPENYRFPDLDQLATDIVDVMDDLSIRTVIAIGEGAGANILCRFGLNNPNRCMGLVLIDCTSSTAGIDEKIKTTMFNWKEGSTKMVDKVMRYLMFHKQNRLHSGPVINPANLAKYLDSYLKRTDICTELSTNLKVETLLMCGSLAPNVRSVYAMNRLNSKLTTIVILDGTGDVLFEAPRRLTRALILFCKGCGVLLGIPMLGLEKEFNKVEQKRLAQAEGSESKSEIQDEMTVKMLLKLMEAENSATVTN